MRSKVNTAHSCVCGGEFLLGVGQPSVHWEYTGSRREGVTSPSLPPSFNSQRQKVTTYTYTHLGLYTLSDNE